MTGVGSGIRLLNFGRYIAVYQAEPIHSAVRISDNTETRVATHGLAAHLTATVAKSDE